VEGGRGEGAPIRVAFCIDNMNIGGTELNAIRTAQRLLELGVELRVFTPADSGPLLARYAALGIPVHHLPLTRLYGRTALDSGRRMRELIRQHRVEVVHAHDFYSNIFAAPHARLAGARFVASRRWWEGPDRRTQRLANRASYLLAHRVLANSESVAELLIRQERVPRSRVVVVPNFLDPSAFAAPPTGWTESTRLELGLPAGEPVVGVVANLSPIKDHAMLLRAVAALTGRWPSLHVVLVGGDGGSRGDLEQLARALGLADRVHFAGHRPSQPSCHHLFDISVLTSRSEGMPNSLVEAMAAGRPVVATSVGAIPDAVKEGVTGFLIPPGDVDQLRDRLDRLLGDPGLCDRMGAAGKASARDRYSAGPAVDRLLRLYQGLVIKPAGAGRGVAGPA
jgi:glycosyltransferase involved in cell wall biosynthesis